MTARDSSRAIAHARARRAALRWVDDYRPRGKMYPAICRECHATEWRGRWRWDASPPPDLPRVVCPACERIRDRAAAHVIELTGALPRWWDEVRGLITNTARAELAEHPLERLMEFQIGADRVVIPTTGLHVARRIVAVIVRRFRRAVRLTFGERRTIIEWC